LEQNYFIWHEKKKGNLKHVIGKVKKKVNLRVLWVSPYVSKGVPQSCLDPCVSNSMFCIYMLEYDVYLNRQIHQKACKQFFQLAYDYKLKAIKGS